MQFLSKRSLLIDKIARLPMLICFAILLITPIITFGTQQSGVAIAKVDVICPFSVSASSQSQFELPSNATILYTLHTLAECTISNMTGELYLYTSNSLIYSTNVIIGAVSQTNSIYSITLSNSILHYGAYDAVANFSSFISSNTANAVFTMLGPLTSTTFNHISPIAEGSIQKLNATVTNGTPGFTYNFKVYDPHGTIVANAIYGSVSASTNSFAYLQNSLWGTGIFTANLVVSDSASPSESATNTISYNVIAPVAQLKITSISPASPLYDLDQPIDISATWNGGLSPYTANWIVNSGSNTVYDAVYGSLPGTSNTLGLSASILGIGNYAANVILNDDLLNTTNSIKDDFSINPSLTAGTPTPLSPTLTSGQSTTLTANPSGGSSPYTYVWYTSSNSICNSGSVAVGTGPSITTVPTGSSYFCYTVTDSATTSETATSSADLVTIANQSSTTTTIPGGGGGGGGGGFSSGGASVSGGSGVQKPTQINMFTNQTSVIVNLLAEQTTLNITSHIQNVYEIAVLGIASRNQFNTSPDNIKINFTADYITPTGAGITINNKSYSLTLYNSVTINQTLNPNYTIKVSLVNISYAPILHTISLTIKPLLQEVNITTQNFTGSIPTNKMLSVRNVTLSSYLPSLPSNYDKQLVQNVSVIDNSGNATRTINTSVHASISYNCSIPFYEEVPLILKNQTWQNVSSYSVMANECKVTFGFSGDPVIAIAKYAPPTNTLNHIIPIIPAGLAQTPPIVPSIAKVILLQQATAKLLQQLRTIVVKKAVYGIIGQQPLFMRIKGFSPLETAILLLFYTCVLLLSVAMLVMQSNMRVEGYCMECEQIRRMKYVRAEGTSNGRKTVSGICPVCRSKMYGRRGAHAHVLKAESHHPKKQHKE